MKQFKKKIVWNKINHLLTRFYLEVSAKYPKLKDQITELQVQVNKVFYDD